MKKVISLFLAAALCASLTGCGLGAKQAAKVSSGKGAELALSTDVGSIDDRSFNQGSWEGLAKYSEEFGITHKYYQPLRNQMRHLPPPSIWRQKAAPRWWCVRGICMRFPSTPCSRSTRR